MAMLQDGKALKTAIATDIDGLAAQSCDLCDDLAKRAQSVALSAERRSRRMGSDLSEGGGEVIRSAERKGKGAETEFATTLAARTRRPL